MNSINIDENDSKDTALIPTSNGNTKIKEAQIGSPAWSELPSAVVEKVYSFLDRQDQNSMSSVCLNWRKECSSPSLWRKVTFYFPDFESNAYTCPDVIFAWRYGAIFHHLELIFRKVPPQPFLLSHETYLRQLIFFLRGLTLHSQLQSMSFKNMHDYFSSLLGSSDYLQLFADVYEAILSLVKSQKKLQFVEIIGCRFKAAEAAEIVKTLIVNNSKTLRVLQLAKFVRFEPRFKFADVVADDHLNFLVFMNLETLSMDYTPMFENMMVSFYEYRNKVDMRRKEGRLKEIRLIFDASIAFTDYLGIDPLVWSYFSEVFPGLRIDLKMLCLSDHVNISTFIVHHMPIRVLLFKCVFATTELFRTLLLHVTSCDINKTIEQLSLIWKGISPNLAPDLVNFTNLCPELKTLELEVAHPAKGLDTVFKGWMKNRPVSLRAVKITIMVNSEEQRTQWAKRNYFYARLLQALRINLSLKAILKSFFF